MNIVDRDGNPVATDPEMAGEVRQYPIPDEPIPERVVRVSGSLKSDSKPYHRPDPDDPTRPACDEGERQPDAHWTTGPSHALPGNWPACKSCFPSVGGADDVEVCTDGGYRQTSHLWGYDAHQRSLLDVVDQELWYTELDWAIEESLEWARMCVRPNTANWACHFVCEPFIDHFEGMLNSLLHEPLNLCTASEIVQETEQATLTDGGLPPPEDGPDPWCTWCDTEPEDGRLPYRIRGEDGRWPPAFCSLECASRWGNAAQQDWIYQVDGEVTDGGE